MEEGPVSSLAFHTFPSAIPNPTTPWPCLSSPCVGPSEPCPLHFPAVISGLAQPPTLHPSHWAQKLLAQDPPAFAE